MHNILVKQIIPGYKNFIEKKIEFIQGVFQWTFMPKK
jgi:hypothetical protein